MKKKKAGLRKRKEKVQKLRFFHDDRPIDVQLEEKFGKQGVLNAQDYLAQHERQRTDFEKMVSRQDDRRRKITKARYETTYGPELLRTAADRRAVDLVEKLIAAIAHASTRGHLVDRSGSVAGLGNVESILHLAEVARALFLSIRTESPDFFASFGMACAKVRAPRQLHRATIAYILEARRIVEATDELRLQAERPAPAIAPADVFDTARLYHVFKSALQLDESTEGKRKANYASFMRTLKDMQDEGLIAALPRTKPGKGRDGTGG